MVGLTVPTIGAELVELNEAGSGNVQVVVVHLVVLFIVLLELYVVVGLIDVVSPEPCTLLDWRGPFNLPNDWLDHRARLSNARSLCLVVKVENVLAFLLDSELRSYTCVVPFITSLTFSRDLL